MALMLAKAFVRGKHDPKEYMASEKYDGYRAYWNGRCLSTRGGHIINAPDWFVKLLPTKDRVGLDGELWMGRGNYQLCSHLRRREPDNAKWIKTKFMVFDNMDKEKVEKRHLDVARAVSRIRSRFSKMKLSRGMPKQCPIHTVKQTHVRSSKHLNAMFSAIIRKGGEGLMLIRKGSVYEHGRTRKGNLLKLKKNSDAECEVIGYKKNSIGQLKSFICKDLKHPKSKFLLAGFPHSVSRSFATTHKVGTKITYIYNGRTDSGLPRHARYFRKK